MNLMFKWCISAIGSALVKGHKLNAKSWCEVRTEVLLKTVK